MAKKIDLNKFFKKKYTEYSKLSPKQIMEKADQFRTSQILDKVKGDYERTWNPNPLSKKKTERTGAGQQHTVELNSEMRIASFLGAKKQNDGTVKRQWYPDITIFENKPNILLDEKATGNSTKEVQSRLEAVRNPQSGGKGIWRHPRSFEKHYLDKGLPPKEAREAAKRDSRNRVIYRTLEKGTPEWLAGVATIDASMREMKKTGDKRLTQGTGQLKKSTEEYFKMLGRLK